MSNEEEHIWKYNSVHFIKELTFPPDAWTLFPAATSVAVAVLHTTAAPVVEELFAGRASPVAEWTAVLAEDVGAASEAHGRLPSGGSLTVGFYATRYNVQC